MKGLISIILVGVILMTVTEQAQGAVIKCQVCKPEAAVPAEGTNAEKPAVTCEKDKSGTATDCADGVTACTVTFLSGGTDALSKDCGAPTDTAAKCTDATTGDICICLGEGCNEKSKKSEYGAASGVTPATGVTPAPTTPAAGEAGADKGGATLIHATGLIPLLIIGGLLAVGPLKTQVC